MMVAKEILKLKKFIESYKDIDWRKYDRINKISKIFKK